MTENRKILNTSDLDGFDKRKLPSPGFQVEIVLADYNVSASPTPSSQPAPNSQTDGTSTPTINTDTSLPPHTNIETRNKDDVFSDSEAEEGDSTKNKRSPATNASVAAHVIPTEGSETEPSLKSELYNTTHGIEQVSLKAEEASMPAPSAVPEARMEENKNSLPFRSPEPESSSTSEFKAIAADASVFSFGDEDEDYESE